jgi:hypothetical protein
MLAVLLFAAFLVIATLFYLYLWSCFRKTEIIEEKEEASKLEATSFQSGSRENVQEIKESSELRRVFILKSKCGNLGFLEQNMYDAELHYVFNKISFQRKRIFVYETFEGGSKINGIKNCYIEINVYDRNIWKIKEFGIDPARNDVKKFRLMIHTIDIKWMKKDWMFIEVCKWDYQRIELLEFCGFQIMPSPPYQVTNEDNEIYYLPHSNERTMAENV